MNIALCTMLDDNFFVGYVGFIKSFLKYNRWFKYDFVIIDNGLCEGNKEHIKSYYDKIVFKKPNKKKYADVNFNKTHDKLKATFYKLDVFRYSEYDRIVFMDMDIIVLDNIKKIFECKDDISGCRAYNARQDELMSHINSGVFVINKSVINKHIYNALIRIARKGYSMPDQKVINRHFAGKIKYIDKTYNVEKRMLHTEKYRDILDNAKCIHYVATKPWERLKPNAIEASFEKLEKIWRKYFNE